MLKWFYNFKIIHISYIILIFHKIEFPTKMNKSVHNNLFWHLQINEKLLEERFSFNIEENT